MNSNDQQHYLHSRAVKVGRLFDPTPTRSTQNEPLSLSHRTAMELSSFFQTGQILRSSSSSASLRKRLLHRAIADREETSFAEEVLENALRELGASHLDTKTVEATPRYTELSRPATQRYLRTEEQKRRTIPVLSNQQKSVAPFAIDGTVQKSRTMPVLSQRRKVEIQKSKLQGKYRDFFRKYYETQLESIAQRTNSAVQDSAMRVSLTELCKYTRQNENYMKPKSVQQAVASFKQEKLAFIYGQEFRGRYISRTHGDILK